MASGADIGHPLAASLAHAAAFLLAGIAGVSLLQARKKRSRMCVRAESEYDAKRAAIVGGGTPALKVLMDFDRTITTYWGPSGGRGASCHGILEAITDASFRAKADALNHYYWPIETSPELSREAKIPYMEAWYASINRLLVESGMKRGDVVRAVARANVQLRRGVKEIIDMTAACDIPLVIFSAGIGDVLREVLLQKYGPLPSNVHIVSNWMTFDEADTLVDWSAPLIHMFNKNSEHLRRTRLFSELSGRRNVVLVGDGLGDETMSDGMSTAAVLKYGLLNDNVQALMSKYLAAFDVVLPNDAPLDVVVELLEDTVAATTAAAQSAATAAATVLRTFTGVDTPGGAGATPVQ